MNTGNTALQKIRTHLTTMREFADRGEYTAMQVYCEENAINLCSAIIELDLFMTGKVDNRNTDRDLADAYKLAQGESWLVYLSDGGYSRVWLQFVETDREFVSLDSVSLPAVVNRWLEINK